MTKNLGVILSATKDLLFFLALPSQNSKADSSLLSGLPNRRYAGLGRVAQNYPPESISATRRRSTQLYYAKAARFAEPSPNSLSALPRAILMRSASLMVSMASNQPAAWAMLSYG
jgi:hypothetical protein